MCRTISEKLKGVNKSLSVNTGHKLPVHKVWFTLPKSCFFPIIDFLVRDRSCIVEMDKILELSCFPPSLWTHKFQQLTLDPLTKKIVYNLLKLHRMTQASCSATA